MNKKRIIMISSLTVFLVVSVVLIFAAFLGSDIRIGYAENSYGSTLNSSFYYFSGSNSKRVKFKKGDQVKLVYSIELSRGSLQVSLKDQTGHDVFSKSEGSGEINFTVSQTQEYQVEINASKARGKYKLKWSE
ncbi:hypothetical protein [Paenibacillus sp. GCM10012306]|uniref:hypothetical protein n=1 Tax=Paenibacillus sp. GCM10012306 TaxID=3317342 RepID=UPI003615BB5E